ncbi:MAG TPA: winged helix-turn-helix domain-containing protein [Solirubrobacterales bacterium]|nr:winged helix-turn-helix domain-containing protein [Solirubrobacterales bacterium]
MASKSRKKGKSSGQKSDARTKSAIDPRLVKALGHPVRNDALSILNERVASPNEIAQELGEHVGHVSYHVNVLKNCECIELVDTAPRRGAVEHYYRATARAFLNVDEWSSLPSSVRTGMSSSLMQTVINDASEALKAGTLDQREDRHFSWTPMLVDEDGWKELTEVLEGTLERVFEIQAASAGRLAEADEEGVPVSVAMLGFEAAAPHKQRVAPKKKKKKS